MKSTSALFRVSLVIALLILLFSHLTFSDFAHASAQSAPDIVWERSHTEEVEAIAFSPDGQMLASASEDHTIKLWRVSDGTLINTLTHFDSVNAVTFSPDGQLLASVGRDYINLWRVSNATLIQHVDIGSYRMAIAFTHDGRWLVAGAKVYRISDGSWWGYQPGYSRAFAVSPDGEILAGGQWYNGELSLTHTSNWTTIQDFQPHTESVNSIAFSPDGRTLATGSDDTVVKLSRVPDGALLKTLAAEYYFVYAVAFSPDGDTLASAGEDWPPDHGVIKIWRVSDGAPLVNYTQETSVSVECLAYSPKGNFIAYGRDDGVVVLARNPFASCAGSLLQTAQSFPSNGGSGNVRFSVPRQCNWTATSNANWIIITSNETGIGDGMISYEVRENFTNSVRTGTLTIAGRAFTINQAPIESAGCGYIISRAPKTFHRDGGTRTISISTGQGCLWQVSSNVNWITILSDSSGIGSGTVTYFVEMNTSGSPRSGTITIGRQTFSVYQLEW